MALRYINVRQSVVRPSVVHKLWRKYEFISSEVWSAKPYECFFSIIMVTMRTFFYGCSFTRIFREDDNTREERLSSTYIYISVLTVQTRPSKWKYDHAESKWELFGDIDWNLQFPFILNWWSPQLPKACDWFFIHVDFLRPKTLCVPL